MAMVSEIAPGVQYQFSAEENAIAASTTRVFRILKEAPEEYVNIAAVCQVNVGDQHPTEADLYCVSYSAQYDGDSRMAILATFNYRSSPPVGGTSQDKQEQSPEIRPANWAISTSLQEVPAYVWKPITGPEAGTVGPTVNPVGDLYEGVTRLEPIVTISVEQFETSDPTRHCALSGYVNSNPIQLGSLSMFPRSCMFRGVQTTPAVEHWGGITIRGWRASYEFAFRVNYVVVLIGASIGWDIAVPQTGFNVKAWSPNFADSLSGIDSYSQPLKRGSDGVSILEPLALPDQVSAGQKMRAMVRIAADDGKTTQRPSAQPVPLNNDGTGRINTASPKVLVYRYQVQNDIDFSAFGLRLT